MPGKQTQKPLQGRVDDYLRHKIPAYAVTEIQNDSATVLLDQIREAEGELELLQSRIARLKGMLARLNTDLGSHR